MVNKSWLQTILCTFLLFQYKNVWKRNECFYCCNTKMYEKKIHFDIDLGLEHVLCTTDIDDFIVDYSSM